MVYFSETDKIKEKISPYLIHPIIDIGAGSHKVVPGAFGIDGRALEGINYVTSDLYNLSQVKDIPKAMAVYSSHCLEHLINDTSALYDWSKLILPGGFLILYLPDARYYDNNTNPEHAREYTYEYFMFYFKRVFCGEMVGHDGSTFPPIFRVIESGPHIGEDLYSFYLVAEKL